MLRRILMYMKREKAIVIITAILVCITLVLFLVSMLGVGKSNAVIGNGMNQTVLLNENEAYLVKYQFDVADQWIPFMDNPNTLDNTENNSCISLGCKKFISIEEYKERMLHTLGEGWTFTDVPQEISSVLRSYEYLLYAEYNDDRIIYIIATNEDKSIAAYVEFSYLQSEYQNNNEFNEVLMMLNTFKVVRIENEVDSAA